MAEISKAEIEQLVKQIVSNLENNSNSVVSSGSSYSSTQYGGRQFIGIYSDMNDAIAAAGVAY